MVATGRWFYVTQDSDTRVVIEEGGSGENPAKLTIYSGVTISSNCCYGVTVFGTNTNGNTLILNGKIEVFDASSEGITLNAEDIKDGVSIKNAVEDANAGQVTDNSNIIKVVSTDDGSGSGSDNIIGKDDETSKGAIKAITATIEKPEIEFNATTT